MQPDSRRNVGKISAGTFANVIRAYIASPKFEGLAKSTRDHYRHLLGLAELPETLGALSVEVIRPSLVQAFLDGLADRPAQKKNARTALKAVEKWALVRDLVPHPFMTGTEAEDSQGGYEPWTDEQVLLAETYSRPELARVITIGVNTGQRGSDIVKMRWSDIEEQEGHLGINVTQQKTGLRIWVPFARQLIAAVDEWGKERKPPFFLVLKPDGTPFTRPQLSNCWMRERDSNPLLAPLKEAGLVLHGLRATAVLRLRKAGARALQISDMIGMSEPMVNRYTRLSDRVERALAAVHYLDRTVGERSETKTDRSKGEKGQ